MGASDRPEWSEKKIAALRQLWIEGISSSEIGRQLGVSKNAVIGKAHRLNLPHRPSPIRESGGSVQRHTRAKRRRPPAPMLETLSPIQSDPAPTVSPAAAASEAPSSNAPNQTRRASARPCCWPIGDPGTPGFRFCDLPAEAGKPYCSEHCDIAYARPAKHHGDAEV